MIEFRDLINEVPYKIFKENYSLALKKGQKNIDAISISSYNPSKKEVQSRFVNLKFIDKDEFIFFTNYNSPKAISFDLHNQITALIYWQSTNTQIRLKSLIRKTSQKYNQEYFNKRSAEKNALAISSNQSKEIHSFEDIQKKYDYAKKNKDLSSCPDYWGGYAFTPYEIEFWQGNKFRLNRRDLYLKKDNNWIHSILEP